MAATIQWAPTGATNSFNLVDGQLVSSAVNSCTGTNVTATFADPDGAAAAIEANAAAGNPPFPDFQLNPITAPVGGRANMQMDAAAQNESTQLVLDFGAEPALDLTFPVFDVDFNDQNPNDWTDIVQITALNGATSVPITIACTLGPQACTFVVTGDGTATATATGDANNTNPNLFTDANGLAQITIPGPVTQVTIDYIAGGNLLGPQFIGIGSLIFDCQADLSITKTDIADPVVAGDLLIYNVTVTNNGPGIAENAVVTDTLPAGVTFQTTTGCTNDPTGVPVCNLGPIPINGSAQYTISTTVNSNTPAGIITNNASVASDAVEIDPTNNSASEDTTIIAQNPQLGLAKDLISVTPGPDIGAFTVIVQLTLENLGNVILADLELFDDILTQFNGLSPTNFVASSNGTLLVNPAWNGSAASNILQPGQSLDVGFVDSVNISFQVTPGANTDSVDNLATVEGTTPNGAPVTDTSTDGLDPDPNNDNIPDEQVPTPIVFDNPALGVAKDLLSVTPGPGAGVFTVNIQLTLENFGNVNLTNLELFDDIVTQFSGLNPTAFNTSSNGSLLVNPVWNGTTASNILQTGQSLAVGAIESVNISFQVTPGTAANSVDNLVIVEGTTPTGAPVTDISTDGLDPDPNNDNIPNEQVPTPVPFNISSNPALGVAKDVVAVIPNGTGTFAVTIRLTLENFGNITLTNLQLFDDVITQFAGLNPTNFSAVGNGALAINANWNGTAASNILQAGQSLVPGAVESVDISFQVSPGATTSVENIAITEGTTPTGTPVTDTSTDGLDPDPNNDNIPNEQVPTPVAFENPLLGIGKDLISVTPQGNGIFTVVFQLTIENFGNVALTNLELFDDLATQFASVNPANFAATSIGLLTINPAWDGTAVSNILQAGQSLAAGAPPQAVQISFQVTPGTTTATLNNLAIGRGTPPSGTPITDTSTDGLDPDPNGDNIPVEQFPTPVTLPPNTTENPILGLAKAGVSLIANNDGTFDVQFGLIIENSGDVTINNLVITDDILTQFAGLNPTSFVAIGALDGSLAANPNWDGGAFTNILQTGQSLDPAQSSQVFIAFQITPTVATTVDNLAFTRGETPAGTPVNDTSTDGINPDPNGDGIPDESVPTPLPLAIPTIPTLNIWALGILLTILSLLGGRVARGRTKIAG